jgi:hypothetical protein
MHEGGLNSGECHDIPSSKKTNEIQIVLDTVN